MKRTIYLIVIVTLVLLSALLTTAHRPPWHCKWWLCHPTATATVLPTDTPEPTATPITPTVTPEVWCQSLDCYGGTPRPPVTCMGPHCKYNTKAAP